ncbi:hypothetical protein JCM16138_04580 [Thermococcus atlanticus]
MKREREAALALMVLIFFSMFSYPSIAKQGKMETPQRSPPAPAQNPDKPDIAVTSLAYAYINSTHMEVHAHLINRGSDTGAFNVSFRAVRPPNPPDVREIPFSWVNLSSYLVQAHEVYSGAYITNGSAILKADDGYIVYRLPFTLNYFGRYIENISINTNGVIELLERWELPQVRDYYGLHADGDYRNSDIIFALDDDLETEDGYLAVVGFLDRVVIEWFGSTYDDYDSSGHPVHFQVVIFANGTIRWSYLKLNYSGYSYDLFAGYHSKAAMGGKGVPKGEMKSFEVELPEISPTVLKAPVAGLSGGSETDVSVTLPIGDMYIEAVADEEEKLNDEYRYNNIGSIGIWPGDYWIENVTVDGDVKTDSYIKVDVTLRTTSEHPENVAVELLMDNETAIRSYVPGYSFADGTTNVSMYWHVQGGSYRLGIKIESRGDTDPSNNYHPIGAYNLPMPNFRIANYSVEIPNCTGDYAAIALNITNDGDANWSNFNVRALLFYANDTPSEDGRTVWGLKTGEVREVVLQPEIKPGNITGIAIFLDPENGVREKNEDDNTVNLSYQREIYPPDFIVEAIYAPLNATTGNTYTVNVTIDNLGGCYAGTVLVKLYENGWSRDSEYISDSGRRNVSLSWRPSRIGRVNLTAVVDPYDDIPESNENNNELTEEVFVNGPDIVITNVTLISFDGMAGSRAAFNVTVKNLGEDFSGYFKIATEGGLRDDYTYIYGGLARGEERWVILSPMINGGRHNITFVADSRNYIPETNESNNAYNYPLDVPLPNFVIDSVEFPDNTVGDVRINITLKNIGAPFNATSYPLRITVIPAGYSYRSVDIGGIIGTNDTATGTLEMRLQAPGTAFEFVVNKYHYINETSYSDNTFQANYTTGYPDLTVEISVPEFSAGEYRYINFTVKNAGNATLSVRNSYYLTDLWLRITVEDERGSVFYQNYELAPLTLKPNESILKSIRIYLNGGLNVINATIDPSGRWVESNESNNLAQVIAHVPKPDFTITSYSVPEEILNGTAYLWASYRIKANVTNLGGNFSNYLSTYLYDNGSGESSASIYRLSGGETKEITLYYHPKPGIHNLTLAADPTDVWIEGNELNNNVTISNLTFGLPELVPLGVTWEPYNFTSGERVTFKAYVRNTGQSFYRSFTVRFEVWNGSAMIASGSGYPSSWYFNENETKEFRWTWYNAKPGNLTLRVFVDYYSRVPELDERNNNLTADLGSIGTPDFDLSNLSVGPLAYGKWVDVNVTLRNLGEAIYRPFSLLFNISGELGYLTVYGMGANESRTIRYRWYVDRVGEANITVVADPGNEISESREDNNAVSGSYWIETPELAISGWRWVEEDISRGYLTFLVNVTNLGGDTYRGFHIGLYVDGELKGSVWVSSLMSGETVEKTLRWRFNIGGTHNISIAVDPYNAVPESNEDNNEVSTEVSIELPDITVESLSIPELNANGHFTINATIRNAGGIGIGRGFFIALFQDDRYLGGRWVDSLGAGESITVGIKIRPYPGDSTLRLIADYYSSITELREDNNELSRTVHVRAPNLVLVSLSPGRFEYPGDTAEATIRVRNDGDFESGIFYAALKAGDRILGGVYVESISPGGEANVSLNWTVKGGTYNLTAILDPYNSLREWNEGDNSVSILMHVPVPDLRVENLTYSGEAKAGGFLSFTVTIANAGNTTREGFYVGIYANSSLVALKRVSGISAGERVTLNFPKAWKARYGRYTLKAAVDVSDEVEEREEGNNERAIDVFITDDEPPELVQAYPENGSFTREAIIGAFLRDAGAGLDVTRSELRLYRSGVEVDGSTTFSSGWLVFQNSSPLEDGNYTALVIAYDRAGNGANYSFSFVLDRKPPEISTNIINGTAYNGSITPEINVFDENLASYRVTINGIPFTGGSITADGSYYLVVTAGDRAGNTARYGVWFTVNGIPSPPSDLTAVVNGSYVELSWLPSGSEDIAGYYVYKDGVRVNEVPIALTRFRGAYTGSLNYSVTAVDFAGQESEPATLFPVRAILKPGKLVEGYPANITVVLENLDGNAEASLTLEFVNALGNTLASERREVTLGRGNTTLNFILTVPEGTEAIAAGIEVNGSSSRSYLPVEVEKGKEPEITVGKLYTGLPGLVEVSLRNLGSAPLDTSRGILTLGNITGEPLGETPVLMPDESTTLRYRIVPASRGEWNITYSLEGLYSEKSVEVRDPVVNPVMVFTENFVRGSRARVTVTFRNTGSAPLRVGMFEVLGMRRSANLIVEPNLSASASFEYTVPLDAPDELHFNATVFTDVGIFRRSAAVETKEPPYNAGVEVEPVFEAGEEIVIRGEAHNASGLLPNVPVKVSIARGGFVRQYLVVTNESGRFRLTFEPLHGESGHFIVSATHPDVEALESDASFDIVGIDVSPQVYRVTVPREFNGTVRIRLRNYWKESNVSVSVDAPSEYKVTVPEKLQIQPGTTWLEIGLSSENARNGTITVTFRTVQLGRVVERNLTIEVKVLPPAPVLLVEPRSLDIGILANESGSGSIEIRNAGFETLRNVSVASSIPWVRVVSNFTELEPGGTAAIALYIVPPANITGVFNGKIEISSSNYRTVEVPLRVTVTPEGRGSLTVIVADTNGTRLSGAKVILTNEYAQFEGETANNGTITFTDVPVGDYTLFVSEESHYTFSEKVTIEAGVERNVRAVLMPSILQVEWEVVPVTIQDVYLIKHEIGYTTYVPAPEIVSQGGDLEIQINYERLAEVGVAEVSGQLVVTNTHRYVSVYNITFETGGSHYIDVDFAVDKIDELKPGETVIIPYVIRIYHHRSPPINPCLHETKVFQLKAGIICVEEAGKITLRAQKVHQIVVKPTCEGCFKAGMLLAGKLGFIVLGQKVGDALGNLDPSSVSPALAGEALGNLEGLYDALGQAWMNPSDENLKNLAKTFNGAKNNLASLFIGNPVAYHAISSTQLSVITDRNGRVIGFATNLNGQPTYALAMGVVKINNGNVQVDWKKATNIGTNIATGLISNLGGAFKSIAGGLNILQLLIKAAEDLPPYIAQAALNCGICLLHNECTPPRSSGSLNPLSVGVAAFGGGDYQYLGGGGSGGGSVSVGKFTCEGLPTVKKASSGTVSSTKSCSSCGGFKLSNVGSVAGGRVCRRIPLSPLEDGTADETTNTLHMCIDLIITIEQRLTFERQAFRASLKFTNTNANYSLEDVNVSIDFFDSNLSGANDRFFVRLDEKSGLVNGELPPNGEARMRWLIIPKVGAAGEFRTRYYVMARITAKVGNTTLIYDTWPVRIDVEPVPQLELDYVIPRKVYGDDPYTPEIEPPVPFIFGVRVKNTGYGEARNLRIASAQPKIERSSYPGVYINFRIIGTLVDGKRVPNSLTVDFGDLKPGESSTAAWLMTAEVTGDFVYYNATFRHSDELGGNETSLIRTVRTHFLVRAFNNTAENDGMMDFLVDDDGDGEPDKIIDSTGGDYPVLVGDFREEMHGSVLRIIPVIKTRGWIYLKVPHSGSILIRSDGKMPIAQWSEDDGIHLLDLNTPEFYVLVVNRPPVPLIRHREPVLVNETVTFDASLSYDPDGRIVRYLWRIGNRSFDGAEVNYTFTVPGTYEVSLTVWDDEGMNSTTGENITVLLGPRFEEELNVSPEWGIVPFNVTLSLNVTNTGDAPGIYNATLKVDGEEREWRAERIEPGSWKLFNFTVELNEPGSHRIGVSRLNATVWAYLNVTGSESENLSFSKDFGFYNSLHWRPFREDFESWSLETLKGIGVDTSRFDEVIELNIGNWSLLNRTENLSITSETGWINATYERNATIVGIVGWNYTTLKLTQRAILFGNATHRIDRETPVIEVEPGSGIYPEIPLFNVTVTDESNVTVWATSGNESMNFTMISRSGNVSIWRGMLPLNIGNNTLTVFAEDEFGNRANVTLWVYLNPKAPVILIESPAGKVYNSGTVWVNYTVVDNDTLGIRAHLDGSLISTSENFSRQVKLSYGWHNFTVRAWDVSYNVSRSVLFRINEPPQVGFTWNASYLTVDFVSNASDPDGISRYLWDFGDGCTSTEATPTHIYSQGGIYNVTLTVWDGYNLSSSVSRAVEVFANVSLTRNESYIFSRYFGFYNTTSWEPFRREFGEWVNGTLAGITISTDEFESISSLTTGNWSLTGYSENLTAGSETGWINATYMRSVIITGTIDHNITTLLLIQRVNLFGNASHVPDDRPPAVEIIYPANRTYDHNITEITVRVEDESPIAWVKAALDGRRYNLTFENGTWIAEINAGDGRHELRVSASDVWGNVGNATVIFAVNTSVRIIEGNNTTVTIIPGEAESEVKIGNGTVSLTIHLKGAVQTFMLPPGRSITVDERVRSTPWLLVRSGAEIGEIDEDNEMATRGGTVYKIKTITLDLKVSRGGYAVLTVPLHGMRPTKITAEKNGTRYALTAEVNARGYFRISGDVLYIVVFDDPLIRINLEQRDMQRTVELRRGIWMRLGIMWEARYLRMSKKFEEIISGIPNTTTIDDAMALHRKAEEYFNTASNYNPILNPAMYAIYMRRAYLTELKALRLLKNSGLHD